MIVFVNRANGVVSGVATVPQEGWTNEALEDDHQEVVDYKNRVEKSVLQLANSVATANRERQEAIEHIERRMSLGAPAEEVLPDVINLLRSK